MENVIILGVVVAIGLILLFSSIYTVSQQDYAVLERLGKFLKVSGPGLHFRVPIIDQVKGKITVRVRELNVKVNTKTSDNVFVDLAIAVQYYIRDNEKSIWNAFYKLSQPQSQMESYIFDVVRATVPTMDIDSVFTEKERIAQEIKETLADTMEEYGFSIVKALVNDIQPASNVVEAMNEINAQERLRRAAEHKAEADKVIVVKAAEADSEAKRLSGEGIASQREAIVKGMQESVSSFSQATGLDASVVVAYVGMSQYYDTIGGLADKSQTNTVLIPHGPSAVNDYMEQFLTAGIATDKVSKDVQEEESSN